jgi:succinate dehydrogenase / fumarate reductase iron-sulfur subunit
MRIEILRRKKGEKDSYLQVFEYEKTNDDETVLSVLNNLNLREELKDINGEKAEKIVFKSSCGQKKCGSCAMLINGRPGLACASRISQYSDTIRLEPLKKFPVVEDLVVDRSIMEENLKQMKVFFEDKAIISEKRNQVSYEASRCLQCGCCLEVCPNFSVDNNFTGMAGAMPMSRIINELDKKQLKEISKAYNKFVYNGCGKSLSCVDICPAKIKIEDMLVNSNAIAVWKRYLKD